MLETWGEGEVISTGTMVKAKLAISRVLGLRAKGIVTLTYYVNTKNVQLQEPMILENRMKSRQTNWTADHLATQAL